MNRAPTAKSIILPLAASMILYACGAGATQITNAIPSAPALPTQPPAAPTATAQVIPTAAPAVPTVAPTPAGPAFSQDAGAVNRDATQAAQTPALAVGSTVEGAPGSAWVTWAENAQGGLRQIFVSELTGGAFEPRGAALNIHLNVLAEHPSIIFAGQNRLVPWAAWVEPSPGFGGLPQIFASRFNAASGLWQPAGQDRGGSEPSLNLHTNRSAVKAIIFAGSGDPTQPPVPWVAWLEESGSSNFVQVFVARGVKDDTAIGGFRWEQVGQQRNGEPSLNVDVRRDAEYPEGVFAETGNSVPWVTWAEFGADRPSRIFTARGVADANSPGGFKWINVPPCTPDETACALNVNPLKDAEDAIITAGSLNPGEAAVPWIVWDEEGPTGKPQVFVSRLDTATRNSFLNVGASLNVDQNHEADAPYIVFVNNVPYVAFLEDDGTGKFRLHVRHLASDPQTGTWALDSPPAGFNLNPALSATSLFAASSGDALYLAWTEGDPEKEVSQVFVGHLTP